MYSSKALRDFRSSARGKAVTEGRLSPRDCTKEEQINCIGECEWVKDWWNPFSAGSCHFKETKNVIYDSYCADSSDPKDLINLLVKTKATGHKAYAKTLSKMSKSALCQELDNYLETLADSTGGFDVSNFWSWGITRQDFTRALGYALDAYPVRNIMGTIKFIAGYFKRNKWIRVTAYAVAVVIVFYFVVPQKHIDNINEIVDSYYNAAIDYFVPPLDYNMREEYPFSWFNNVRSAQPLSSFKESWDDTIKSLENEEWEKYFDPGDRIVDHIRGDSIDMSIYTKVNGPSLIDMYTEMSGRQFNAGLFEVRDETFVKLDEETRNSIHHIIDKDNLIRAYENFVHKKVSWNSRINIIRGDNWQVMIPNTNGLSGNNEGFLPGIINDDTYPVRYYDLPSGVNIYDGVKTVLDVTFDVVKFAGEKLIESSRTQKEMNINKVRMINERHLDYINSILAIVYTMM